MPLLWSFWQSNCFFGQVGGVCGWCIGLLISQSKDKVVTVKMLTYFNVN